ncbi:hypothetical protein AB4G91_08190 [Macrococcoides goetzii]|nr:hypothetical protein [Macrococcus sp. PK]
MAKNGSKGKGRKGAVKNRSQTKNTKTMRYVKRDKKNRSIHGCKV